MNKKKHTFFLKAGKFLVLAFYLIMVILPIYWMLVTSLKSRLEIFGSEITYWPKVLSFQNYIDLFGTTNFLTYVKNSVIIATVTGLAVLFFALSGGYALARFRFRGKRVLLIAFLISQMIPTTLLLIPSYLIILKLKLNNTIWSLMLYYIGTNIPFCLITMRSFFARIPDSLEEAACVDGCSQVGALVRVVIPIMLPGIVATFVFAFTGAWNELLAAVLFITKDGAKTIPVGLSSFVNKISVEWGQMCAGGIIAMIPTVIMFAFMQKYLVEGLTAGAVKG